MQPSNLRRAIEHHLNSFKTAYGEDAIRPKHHYALHLPSILARFGFLISTFTHERKHRAFKRYARPRTATLHFELGVIEDMLAHNTWELGHKHMAAFTTSKPTRRMLNIIREQFPDEAHDAATITTHREVLANGRIVTGDIIAYVVDGRLHIGELLINTGFVYADGAATMRSIASSWAIGKGASEGGINLECRDTIMKFDTNGLKQSFTHRMAEDRKSCFVLVPHEFLSIL